MFPESNAAKNNTVVKYYLKTLSLLIPLMSYSITCYDVLNNLLNVRKLYLDVLHVPTLIGKFWKTSNPRNFQTNNTRKLPLVQMNKLFKGFSMMYHKCQKSSISKSLKTLNKKKVDRAQSPSPKFFWVGTISSLEISHLSNDLNFLSFFHFKHVKSWQLFDLERWG